MTTENTTHKAEQEVIDLARKVVKCNDGYEVYRRVFKMAEAIERLDAMLSASKSQQEQPKETPVVEGEEYGGWRVWSTHTYPSKGATYVWDGERIYVQRGDQPWAVTELTPAHMNRIWEDFGAERLRSLREFSEIIQQAKDAKAKGVSQ